MRRCTICHLLVSTPPRNRGGPARRMHCPPAASRPRGSRGCAPAPARARWPVGPQPRPTRRPELPGGDRRAGWPPPAEGGHRNPAIGGEAVTTTAVRSASSRKRAVRSIPRPRTWWRVSGASRRGWRGTGGGAHHDTTDRATARISRLAVAAGQLVGKVLECGLEPTSPG